MKNIIQAGLFTLLGTILGALIVWAKETDIQKKKFEYDLINSAMAIDDESIRTDKLKLYISTGLIEEIDTDSLVYKINYHRGFKKGQDDNKAERHLKGAIGEFIKIYHRSPHDLNELGEKMPIKMALDHFAENIMYRAWAPDQFLLRFPGRDGVLFSEDDKITEYEDVI